MRGKILRSTYLGNVSTSNRLNKNLEFVRQLIFLHIYPAKLFLSSYKNDQTKEKVRKN